MQSTVFFEARLPSTQNQNCSKMLLEIKIHDIDGS